MNREIILETKNYIKELKNAGIRNDLNQKLAEAAEKASKFLDA